MRRPGVRGGSAGGSRLLGNPSPQPAIDRYHRHLEHGGETASEIERAVVAQLEDVGAYRKAESVGNEETDQRSPLIDLDLGDTIRCDSLDVVERR